MARTTFPDTDATEPTRPVGGVRAKRYALLECAASRGIEPTPLALARFAGVPHRTMKRALAGGTISATTINRLMHAFGVPFETLFESAPDDDAPDTRQIAD